jgi:hypothetical protein
LPHWFFVVRAVALLVIGIILLLHETFYKTDAVRVVVILAAFLLMGFSAADIGALWRRNGG